MENDEVGYEIYRDEILTRVYRDTYAEEAGAGEKTVGNQIDHKLSHLDKIIFNGYLIIFRDNPNLSVKEGRTKLVNHILNKPDTKLKLLYLQDGIEATQRVGNFWGKNMNVTQAFHKTKDQVETLLTEIAHLRKFSSNTPFDEAMELK